eukprot:m51a1_g5621 putative -alpha-glucan branching enzyme (725) ;mRNA; f:773370-775984
MSSAQNALLPSCAHAPEVPRDMPQAPTQSGAEKNSGVASKYHGATDGTGVIEWDPCLEPHSQTLRARFNRVRELVDLATSREGSLLNFARGFKEFGLHRAQDKDGHWGIKYREWAPGAINLSIIGEFNGWDRTKNPCTKDYFGHWYGWVPDHPDGTPGIRHNTKIKVAVELRPGYWEDRIPAWINRVTQEPRNPVYDGVYWNPPQQYVWRHKAPPRPKAMRVYESHVGMSSEEPKISTYREFKDTVLPYVQACGYNTIQLMAIMEHSYYSCFGYQVTNFFAVSSRFGTPEELKELIDEAHARGIYVLLDIVHSHASNNVYDGLNMFDGTDHHYFHAPPRGHHAIWDSRLFNYGHWETLRFLLSNVAWFLEEYRFDGFRFDGVTSMLYMHHGIGNQTFDYGHYFSGAVDPDALAYLTLANVVIHQINPNAVSVAEDVSGFPCLCRPFCEGGVGFDYRLNMACPDLWVKLLKSVKDEDWNVADIAWMLSNRRWNEPCIAYAESHDQALVGDKTIAFWLMDKDMYTDMSVLVPANAVISRGMSLHKMIRLITFSLAGEGYLNFMGNEFGHPEWIDFPRDGNGNSFHYCRRQWRLVRDPLLRYKDLGAFDTAMQSLDVKYSVLSSAPAYISLKHEADKVIVFERTGLVFAFNFHPCKSFSDYRIPVREAGEYAVVLDTDRPNFGGNSLVDPGVHSFTERYQVYGVFDNSMKVYLPARTAVVWRRKDLL